MRGDLIERMGRPAPRCTSYPAAPHFRTDVTGDDDAEWLAALPEGAGVSLYAHVPFCRQLCRFSNEPATGLYRGAVEAGRLPVARGLPSGGEDRARGDLIVRLTCDFAVHFDALARRHPGAGAIVGAPPAEATHLARHEPDGLAVIRGSTLRVTPRGRPFVRRVASAFDAHLGTGPARHSTAA